MIAEKQVIRTDDGRRVTGEQTNERKVRNRQISLLCPSKSQNIQPIERTRPLWYKYKEGSLYLFCIKSPFNCMFNRNKRKRGGRWRQT